MYFPGFPIIKVIQDQKIKYLLNYISKVEKVKVIEEINQLMKYNTNKINKN
jgi:hypothetical protein